MMLWILAIALAEFQHGYSMGEMSICKQTIIDYSNLPSNKDTYYCAVTMVPLGAMISSFLSGPMSYYGRRKCLIVANLVLIFGIMIMVIRDSACLFIGRFFVGIAVGVFSTIVPLFILEISPIHK